MPDGLLISVAVALVIAATLPKGFWQLGTGKTPDSTLFISIAENLITNFCYSASPVESGACVPTWSQQPPGLVLLIAFAKLVATNSDRAELLMQTGLFLAALLYFCWTMYRWHGSQLLFMFSVTAAVLSPAQYGWSRIMLTECLSSACVLWVFAELARALMRNRFGKVRLSVPVIAGMLIRWDLITSLVPVLVTLLLSHRLKSAIRNGVLISTICALPYLGLMVRAVLVGLPPTPVVVLDAPEALMRWYRLAAIDSDTPLLLWSVFNRHYASVQTTQIEKHWRGGERSAELIRDLAALPNGSGVPDEMAGRFSAAAADLSQDRFSNLVLLPTRRAALLWRDWLGHYPPLTSLKPPAAVGFLFSAYYVLIGIGLLVGAASGNRILRTLSIAALAFVFVRTAFLVYLAALEIRYLDLFFPAFDILGVSALWLAIARRAEPGKLAEDRLGARLS